MLNNEFPPLGGGTASVNLELLRQFKDAADISIDLVTSTVEKCATVEQFSDRIALYKVPIHAKSLHHASVQDLLLYSYRGLRLAIELSRSKKYDLVLAFCTLPAGALAYVLQKLFKSPFVVRISGPDLPGVDKRYRFLYPFLIPFLKLIWSNAAKVIVKCDEELQTVKAIACKAEIEIIRNGVDVQTFQVGSSSVMHPSLRLLSVARLVGLKGQSVIFRALALLRERDIFPHLELIGTGDAEKQYQKEVRLYGLQDQVTFRGYISREELPAYYQKADIFILASEHEGMSIATLEAIASGLPIISTAVGGVEDLLQEGINGFVFSVGDFKGLADAIEKAGASAAWLENARITSRRIAEELSWEKAAALYTALFSSMSEQNRDAQKL